MTTVHILPRTALELRRAGCDLAAHAGALWECVARDDRARRVWELRLSTPQMISLLERLAQGETSAAAGDVTVTVCPDPEAEAAVAGWANQQLARHIEPNEPAAAVRERPVPAVSGRPQLRYLA